MTPEYQPHSVTPVAVPESVIHASQLPRWVRRVLRGWGMLLVVYVVLATIGSAWVGMQLLGENSSWMQLALGLLFVTSLLAQLMYAYHLFKLHRWTIVPSMAFAFISIVSAYQSFYLPLLPGQEWARVLGIALAAWFSFVALLTILHYRHLNSVRWGRVWAGLLLFVLLPYLGFAVATLVLRDIPNVDDTDLLVGMVPVVPEEDNIYYALPDLDELDPEVDAIIERINSEMIEARRNDTEISSTTLGLLATPPMQALLRQYLAALERPEYQCPSSVNNHNYNAFLCALSSYRRLGELANIEATRLFYVGEYQQAATYIDSTLKFAHELQSGQPTLIEYLVGLSIANMTYDTLEQSQSALLMSQATSSQPAVETVLSTLIQYEPDKTGLIDAIKVEYLINKNMLNEPTSLTEEFGADISESYFYQPNRTAQEYANLARLSVEHITADCGIDTGLPEVADKIVNEELRIYEPIEFIEPNFIGQVFLSVTASSFMNTRDHYCEAVARHKARLADFQELREQAVAQSATTTADTIQVE